MSRPTCISLFSGGGGLDIGARLAGFDVLLSSDIWERSKATMEQNSNVDGGAGFVLGDIADLSAATIYERVGREIELDLLIGGPPCPPYSKSRFYLKDKPRGLEDPLGDSSLTHYLRLVSELRPKTFLFENVPGFVFKPHAEALRRLSRSAEELGYSFAWEVVNAANYGVPQIRKRFIFLASRVGQPSLGPPTHEEATAEAAGLFGRQGLPVWRTAGEAIGDLDLPLRADEGNHFAGGKHHDLLCEIPPGDNYLFFTAKRGHPNPQFEWRSRYWSFLLKLSPDLPSWTIQARRSNNMGPFHWGNRILRISEVKRLMSFPDSWELSGGTEDQWRQLGNAVPPLMAAGVLAGLGKRLGAVPIDRSASRLVPSY